MDGGGACLPAAIDISTLALFSFSETRLGESQYTLSVVIGRLFGEIALLHLPKRLSPYQRWAARPGLFHGRVPCIQSSGGNPPPVAVPC